MRSPTSSQGQLRHHEVSPTSSQGQRRHHEVSPSSCSVSVNQSPTLIPTSLMLTRYAHPIAEETEGYRSLFGGLPYHMVSPPLQKGVGAVITPSPSILAPRSFLGRGGSSRWSSSSSRSRMPGLREKIDFTPPQGRSKENQEAFFSLFSYISFITPSSLPFT